MFSLIIIVFILFLSVGLIPSPLSSSSRRSTGRVSDGVLLIKQATSTPGKTIAIQYHAHFLLMKNKKILGGASWVPLTLWKGSRLASIWVGDARPPCFSTFSIIVLWHWCLPVWLLLSVTLHHLCSLGFDNTGASDWHMKPSNPGNASRECCSTLAGAKPTWKLLH